MIFLSRGRKNSERRRHFFGVTMAAHKGVGKTTVVDFDVVLPVGNTNKVRRTCLVGRWLPYEGRKDWILTTALNSSLIVMSWSLKFVSPTKG